MYLAPFLTVPSVLAAYAIGHVMRERASKGAVIAFLVVVALLVPNTIYNRRVYGNYVKVALGLESREEYLSRMLPEYDGIWRYINQNLPEESKIATYDARAYYVERETIWLPDFIYHNFMWLHLEKPKALSGFLSVMKEEDITHVVLQNIDPLVYLALNKIRPAVDYQSKRDGMINWFRELRENHLVLLYSTETANLYELKCPGSPS
jgi:hypothetical protein